ncbi:unnamed protein product [Medioppia subpectinata]|uniref:Methyltransferase type 12 domain-containing protein n=1 Tax=Medioppia subpectinata TaxID=1979941 RepID=A0A7R9KHH5_9ACAR|nr:unnamed protein product [Medioppia subpectinata]CAG2102708.1 unnamed protein product [Medioppia subpectinata]
MFREYDVIVDMGCGSGYLTQLLAHKVKYRQIIAIDSDPTLVVEAQRRYTTDTIRYLHQDLDKPWDEWRPELRALESTANLIVSNIVFQAIEDKTRLMDVLVHLLASGGRVVARFGQTPDLNAKLTEHQRRKYRLFLRRIQRMNTTITGRQPPTRRVWESNSLPFLTISVRLHDSI